MLFNLGFNFLDNAFNRGTPPPGAVLPPAPPLAW